MSKKVSKKATFRNKIKRRIIVAWKMIKTKPPGAYIFIFNGTNLAELSYKEIYDVMANLIQDCMAWHFQNLGNK